MAFGRKAQVIGGAVGIALGALFGAWIDWRWWSPVYGMQIVVILGSVLLLVGAGIVWKLVRRARPLSFVAVALVVGIAGGLAFGPSREMPNAFSGTLTLAVERPVRAETTWPASCSIVPSGTQLSVSVWESLPIAVGADRQAMAAVSLGDMWWRTSADERPDGLSVWILFVDGGPLTDAGPTEHVLHSTAASALEVTSNGKTGSIRFAGLVPERPLSAGDPLADLAGTFSWACDSPPGAE